MTKFCAKVFRHFLLVFAGLLVTLPACARSWNISDYSDSISIYEDGSALVTEHITAVFVGEYHGINRRIPIEYPGPKGTNYTLFLEVVRVTDENSAELKHEVSTDGEYRKIKIYIPDATDAKKQINISYRVLNGIRHFEDFDEFYWNVTGNDWPVTIDHAAADVVFPAKAAGAGLRAQAFTGEYGSKEQEATSKIDGERASFETSNPLPMRGGMTIDVYIPKGIIQEPSAFTKVGWFLKSNPILFLPLFAFVVMYSMWRWKGRDPDPGISVAPVYEPPEDMSPAEVGTLVGDRVHPRDVTSTIVDLAVRGYIKIEETQDKHLLFKSHDYIFHLLKPMNEWQQLSAHERVMLENLFQGGSECRLSSLKNRFYTVVPMLKQDIMTALKQKGMYGLDPQSAAGYSVLAVIIIAAPFVLLQWAGNANFFLSPAMAILAVVIALAIVALFWRIMPAKSLRGARTVVGIKGFQEFMSRVDGDRLRTLPPNTFERFLPYAMVLGVEDHWAKAFASIMQQPPNWYQGYYGSNFNSMMFTHDIRSMTDVAGTTFVSAPRSDSSGSGFGGGGFSGGGFSGGGFGGGGGDAF